MGYEVLAGRLNVCIRCIGNDHSATLEMEDCDNLCALLGVPGLVTKVRRS